MNLWSGPWGARDMLLIDARLQEWARTARPDENPPAYILHPRAPRSGSPASKSSREHDLEADLIRRASPINNLSIELLPRSRDIYVSRYPSFGCPYREMRPPKTTLIGAYVGWPQR